MPAAETLNRLALLSLPATLIGLALYIEFGGATMPESTRRLARWLVILTLCPFALNTLGRSALGLIGLWAGNPQAVWKASEPALIALNFFALLAFVCLAGFLIARTLQLRPRWLWIVLVFGAPAFVGGVLQAWAHVIPGVG